MLSIVTVTVASHAIGADETVGVSDVGSGIEKAIELGRGTGGKYKGDYEGLHFNYCNGG